MKLHFIGIGGIGMSALARAFKRKGAVVTGYDLQKTQLTETLKQEGIQVFYKPKPENIKNADKIIYTPAIPSDFPELTLARKLQKKLYKRAEILAEFVNPKTLFAVAGTHGKTSISATLSYILQETRGVHAFVGGIMKNYHSNFLFAEKSDFAVAEADEYDKSFLYLKPAYSVVSMIDWDHSDIYPSFQNMINSFKQFLRQTRNFVLLHKQAKEVLKNFSLSVPTETYGLEDADFVVEITGNKEWTLSHKHKKLGKFPMYFHSEKVALNTAAAVILALKSGVSLLKIQEVLKNYQGVSRRFEILEEREDFVLIDDYAHHPTEISSFIRSLRLAYPDFKITLFFQPHLYSRTRDFAEEFAESLRTADEVFLLPVYPAREKPLPGITSQIIAKKIPNSQGILPLRELPEKIKEQRSRNKEKRIVALVGAGSIGEITKEITNRSS